MLLLRMIFGKLEIWQWLLAAAVLIPSAVRDIRTKRINGYIIIIGILTALSIREILLGQSSLRLLIDMLPGAFMLAVAFFSRERIGKGDALMLIFVGALAGAETVLFAMFVSMMIAAVLSTVLLVLRKVKRDTKIPFIPFLSIGVIAGGLL